MAPPLYFQKYNLIDHNHGKNCKRNTSQFGGPCN